MEGTGLQDAIITCSDVNMLPAACCALLSAKRHSVHEGMRFLLLAIDLNEESRNACAGFCGHHGIAIELLDYRTPEDLGTTSGRWSRATLARLYLDRFVPEDIERLLYLDADILAVADIDPLIETVLTGKALGAVDDYVMAFEGKARRREQKLGMRHGPRYFNAGMLLFDWRRCCMEARFERLRGIFAARGATFDANDQDALNLAFDGDWLALDPRWNAQTGILPFVQKPAIMHFTGRRKPWQRGAPWIHRPMREAYRAYLAGTAWAGFVADGGLTEQSVALARHFAKEFTLLPRYRRTRTYFGGWVVGDDA